MSALVTLRHAKLSKKQRHNESMRLVRAKKKKYENSK